jgi:cytochrome oxidase Cu insertion factor (SCO1/SenC/PrrC family)
MDHSAYSFLADDHGRVLNLFGHNARASEIADAIRKRLGSSGP